MDTDVFFRSFQVEPLIADRSHLTSSWGGRCFLDDYARFYWICAGEAYLEEEGERYRLTPGGLYMIPGLSRTTFGCESQVDILWCHARVRAYGGISPLRLLDRRWLMFSHGPAQACTLLEQCVNVAGSAGDLLLQAGALLQLLALVYAKIPADEITRPLRGFHRFEPVLRWIEDHLEDSLRVPDLAGIAHLETSYFAIRFRQAIGFPPAEYIKRKRIERAKTELLMTNDTIEAIGLRCGFCDGFHLSKTFRAVMGLSPDAFRRQAVREPGGLAGHSLTSPIL